MVLVALVLWILWVLVLVLVQLLQLLLHGNNWHLHVVAKVERLPTGGGCGDGCGGGVYRRVLVIHVHHVVIDIGRLVPSAFETGDILGKVVVLACFVGAFPVAGTKGNIVLVWGGRAWFGSRAWLGVVSVVFHHGYGAGGWKRAPKTGGSALEIGKPTRRTCPVARTGSVFRHGERCEQLRCPVEHGGGRRLHLDSPVAKNPAVHRQCLGRFFVGCKYSKPQVVGVTFDGPECYGPAAKLGEPRLQFGLGGVGRKVFEIEDFGLFFFEYEEIFG